MTWPTCRFDQSPAASFCPRCGAPCTGSPTAFRAAEQELRVGQNLQALGIAWCVYGAYRLLRTIFAASLLHNWLRWGNFGDAPPILLHGLIAFLPVIALTSAFLAALSFAAGLGLLKRKPWARPLAIGMAVLALVKIPVGTALGIYTLWVLAPAPAARAWTRMQQA